MNTACLWNPQRWRVSAVPVPEQCCGVRAGKNTGNSLVGTLGTPYFLKEVGETAGLVEEMELLKECWLWGRGCPTFTAAVCPGRCEPGPAHCPGRGKSGDIWEAKTIPLWGGRASTLFMWVCKGPEVGEA
jgi:hypothetical protein